MNRRVLLISLVAAAAGFSADPLPSAESVLDRYVQVTGGRQAYEKRKTEISHGTLEYTSLGIKGSITRYAAEPDKYYAALDIEGLGVTPDVEVPLTRAALLAGHDPVIDAALSWIRRQKTP